MYDLLVPEEVEAQEKHWIAEAMKYAFGDRRALGDPDIQHAIDVYAVEALMVSNFPSIHAVV